MLLTSIAAASLVFSPATLAVAGAVDSAPTAVMYAGVSLDQAIQMVQSHYHAKVIKADVGNNDGKRVYLLRVLSPEGRVFAVRVDAETGRMF